MAVFNILDYGAVPDGKTVNTRAIQRAIDLCDKGGTVLIPRGVFISGALFLKSDMTLFLEEGAKLLGSGDVEDFPVMGYPFEGLDQLCYASLINTDGAPHWDITIEGGGVIDANGACLFAAQMAERKGKRGRAVCLRNVERLTIRGVTIRQSPAWCLHLLYCRKVLIDGVEIHTKYDERGERYQGIFNGDGLDLDSCQDVKVTGCLIASQDDCIAVKSGRNEEGRRVGIPSQNILIENCIFKSGFGVAMGSEMSGGVQDVLVRDCTFENAFSIASVKAIRGRGSYIRRVRYENCTLINRDTTVQASRWFKGAIYLDAFYGAEKYDVGQEQETDEGTPIIEDIVFSSLTAETVSGYAVYLCGLPERHFRNIALEHVKAKGPEGFYCENIDGLKLLDVQINGKPVTCGQIAGPAAQEGVKKGEEMI